MQQPLQPPIELDGKKYYYRLALEPVPCPKCGEYCFMAFQLLRVLEDIPTLFVGDQQRNALLNEKGYFFCWWCLHREIRKPNIDNGEMLIVEQSDIEWE